MELQKTPNSQTNLLKEEQSSKHHTSWFQTILQNYSNPIVWHLAIKTDTWINGTK